MKHWFAIFCAVCLLSVPAMFLVNTGLVRREAGVPVLEPPSSVKDGAIEIGQAAIQSSQKPKTHDYGFMLVLSLVVGTVGMWGTFTVFRHLCTRKYELYSERRPRVWSSQCAVADRREWNAETQRFERIKR